MTAFLDMEFAESLSAENQQPTEYNKLVFDPFISEMNAFNLGRYKRSMGDKGVVCECCVNSCNNDEFFAYCRRQ